MDGKIQRQKMKKKKKEIMESSDVAELPAKNNSPSQPTLIGFIVDLAFNTIFNPEFNSSSYIIYLNQKLVGLMLDEDTKADRDLQDELEQFNKYNEDFGEVNSELEKLFKKNQNMPGSVSISSSGDKRSLKLPKMKLREDYKEWLGH
ncbi:hypothetical protein FQR65_LT01612 [Abscondita terminalis]|nr:hypothetical protein FQR65_LT01612 [Abscondita terminalis]